MSGARAPVRASGRFARRQTRHRADTSLGPDYEVQPRSPMAALTCFENSGISASSLRKG